MKRKLTRRKPKEKTKAFIMKLPRMKCLCSSVAGAECWKSKAALKFVLEAQAGFNDSRLNPWNSFILSCWLPSKSQRKKPKMGETPEEIERKRLKSSKKI